MDLVGRKFTMGKGKVFGLWLKQIEDFLEANRGVPQVLKMNLPSWTKP
jgi:hypothetical protein